MSPLWSVKDLAEYLGVPEKTIYSHTGAGATDPFPAYRVGKHLRFKPSEIAEWLESHRVRTSDDWNPDWLVNAERASEETPSQTSAAPAPGPSLTPLKEKDGLNATGS